MRQALWIQQGCGVILLAAILPACSEPPPSPSPTPITLTPVPTQSPSPLAAWPTPYPPPAPPPPVSQSSNGYTVTLYPLAADPSRVLISYTVAGPPQPPLAAVWFGLAASDDWLFQGPHAFVQNSVTELPASSRLPGRTMTNTDPLPADPDATHIWAFDTAALPTLPARLPLHINGNLFANEPSQVQWVVPPPQERELVSDLSFDLSLPVNPQHRIATISQTVRTNDLAITLERVEVAAGETRVYLAADHTAGDPYDSWQPGSIELQIGQWQGKQQNSYQYPQLGLGMRPVDSKHWVTLYPDALLDRQGEWTLTIPEVVWAKYDVANSQAGPWVFHFQMPPPTTHP